MTQKTSTDCCVQTDLDVTEIEIVENISPKMICINQLSKSVNMRNTHLKVDVKNNYNNFQLRKIETIEQNINQERRKKNIYNNKSFHNENEQRGIKRKRQFIQKSFHIETFNDIAIPQQIVLPQKQLFTPLHVLKRKLNYPANPYRLKTCPDE